jgi:probable rRNA maturation factor
MDARLRGHDDSVESQAISMPKNIITINQDSTAWSRIKDLRPRLALAAKIAQQHLPKHLRFPISATLLLTTDAAIRRLNRDFRGMDKATNVLSFPQWEPGDFRGLKLKKTPVEIGDIAIAYQYMVVEARKDHKMLINHVTHLFVHGLLHLFGYDHILDPEAARMERLETRIMAALDLPDPYAPAEKMEPKRSRMAIKKRSVAKHPKK